jgi:hypothetical protein
MIIFMEDREFTNKTVLKEPKDVAWILDQMIDAFSDIESALGDLSIIFLSKNWLQEGQEDVLALYSKAAEKIREKLTRLNMMNTSLEHFLASERRPILTAIDITQQFNLEIDIITKRLNFYYKKVKGTLFPRFDNEVKQCRDIIAAINRNIDRINVINAAHRIRPIRHVKNLAYRESFNFK